MAQKWFLSAVSAAVLAGMLVAWATTPAWASNESALAPVIALLLEEPAVRLSHAQASGGAVITIEHPSIDDGGDLPVVVTSPDGREIKLAATVPQAGRALLSLPVFLTPDGTGFLHGDVHIVLPGGHESRLTMVAPPLLDTVPTGQVVQAFLQHLVASYADARTGFGARDPEIGFAPDNLGDLIDGQATRIETLLSDWLADGTLYLPARDGGSFAVPEPMVKTLDRVLAALVSSAANTMASLQTRTLAYQAASATDHNAIATQLAQIRATAARLESLVYGGEEYERVRRQVRVATNGLISQIREGLSHLDSIPAPLNDAANLGLDAIEAIHRILIDGVLTDLVRSMGQDRYGTPDRPYGETGQVLRDLLSEGLENRSPVDVDFVDAVLRGDYYQMQKIAERYCANAVRPLDLQRYCRLLDDNQGKTVYPRVDGVAVIPRTVLSGDNVNLRTWIGGWRTGANYSRTNTLRIDWGDGSAITTVAQTMGESVAEQSHVYTLPAGDYEERTYDISVTIEGNSPPFIGTPSPPGTVQVTVRSEIQPMSVTCDQAPDGALQPGESGTWTWRVSGGQPPYDVELDWGDGSPKRAMRRTGLTAYWSTHAYRSEGMFDITLKVTDANGVVDSCDSFQFVGDLPRLTVSATDPDATEGSDDATFTIHRTAPLDRELVVSFGLAGTASADDYTSSHAGSIAIPVGASSVEITVTPQWDVSPEGIETVALNLSEPVGFDYELGEPDSAEVSIRDPAVHICDDPAYPYTHRGTQCASFWGCSGSTRVKNGNVFCGSNAFWIFTGGSVDKYACEEPYFQNCSRWESEEVSEVTTRENGFTIVVRDGSKWYPLTATD
jgi:hypothetical protein